MDQLQRHPGGAGPVKPTDKETWLLALDGSRNSVRAARYVARMAKKQGVDAIYSLNVQPPDNLGLYGLRNAQVTRQADAAASRDTAEARRILESAGLSIRPLMSLGSDPATRIAESAKRRCVSEIVMGTRGMSAVENLGLGSVAYKVIHLARQPVTLVPHSRDGREVVLPAVRGALSLVLAVDGSKHAVRAAAYVCRLHGAGIPLDVHVLNVQPRFASGYVRRFVSQAQINAFCRKEGEIALGGARRRLDQAGINYNCYIRAGAFPETIVQLANEHKCTRIVMGTRGLGAVKGLVLGSVTYGVVHLAEMPVTLVK
jgi:nucleotide-binding universal stress UspA family protein